MSDIPPPSANRPPETQSRAFRIGITGHRLDKLSGDVLEVLRGRLRELFARLDAAQSGRLGEVPTFRLVSALAEGADRLAVEAAPQDWPLVALLPMPRAIYRADFLPLGTTTSASAEDFDAHLGGAETIVELPMLLPNAAGEPAPRTAQYAALGHALIGDIDCLVAIWDGKPPAGPGGTATVIAAARERGVPVLWIESSGRHPARLIERPGDGDVASVSTPLDDATLCALIGRNWGSQAPGRE